MSVADYQDWQKPPLNVGAAILTDTANNIGNHRRSAIVYVGDRQGIYLNGVMTGAGNPYQLSLLWFNDSAGAVQVAAHDYVLENAVVVSDVVPVLAPYVAVDYLALVGPDTCNVQAVLIGRNEASHLGRSMLDAMPVVGNTPALAAAGNVVYLPTVCLPGPSQLTVDTTGVTWRCEVIANTITGIVRPVAYMESRGTNRGSMLPFNAGPFPLHVSFTNDGAAPIAVQVTVQADWRA